MPKLNNSYMTLISTHGESQWWGNGHWQHPWIVRNAICEDGRRRSVYLEGDADTYFSWPGRTKIQGTWIKGFVVNESPDKWKDMNNPDYTDDTWFIVNKFDAQE